MSRNTMAIGTLAVLAIGLLATSANAHPKLNSVSPQPMFQARSPHGDQAEFQRRRYRETLGRRDQK